VEISYVGKMAGIAGHCRTDRPCVCSSTFLSPFLSVCLSVLVFGVFFVSVILWESVLSLVFLFCLLSFCSVSCLSVLSLVFLLCLLSFCSVSCLSVLSLVFLFCLLSFCSVSCLSVLSLVFLFCLLSFCSVSCLSVLSLVFLFCLLSLFPSSFFFISCFLLIVLPFDLYLYGSVLFIFCLNFHLSLPAVSSPSIAHFTLNSYIVISS